MHKIFSMRKLVPIFILLMITLFSCKTSKSQSSAEIKDITPKGEHNLLIVESESCIYCKQLDKDMRSDERLKKALAGIDVYKLLYESNAKVRYKFGKEEGVSEENQIAKMLGVNSFPYLLFYDRKGDIVLSIPGYLEPETFACVLDYVKDNEYTRKKLQEYLKERKCA